VTARHRSPPAAGRHEQSNVTSPMSSRSSSDSPASARRAAPAISGVDDHPEPRLRRLQRGLGLLAHGDVVDDALRAAAAHVADLVLPDPHPAVLRPHPVLDIERERRLEHAVQVVRVDHPVPPIGVVDPQVRRQISARNVPVSRPMPA
jgi:hypothetical protein